jgi:hypothetical protein
LNPIFPIVLYSQSPSAGIPSQRRMHGCVVLTSSAASLPCKRAGRRASSGISFSNVVQQAQLSYPKSTQLCRLLEAFEGFGCRSPPQPQTLRDERHIEDVDSLIHLELFYCAFSKGYLDTPSPRSPSTISPRSDLPHSLHLTRNLYPTHRRRQTAANQNLLASPVLGTWATSRTTSNGLLA